MMGKRTEEGVVESGRESRENSRYMEQMMAAPLIQPRGAIGDAGDAAAVEMWGREMEKLMKILFTTVPRMAARIFSSVLFCSASWAPSSGCVL